jgi:hypothetical protein
MRGTAGRHSRPERQGIYANPMNACDRIEIDIKGFGPTFQDIEGRHNFLASSELAR